MIRTIIEMGEWEARTFPDLQFSADDRKLLGELQAGSGHIDFDELRDGIRIRTKAWVGVITFSHFVVRIVPKLAGAHRGLVQMLAYTHGLKALQRKNATHHLQLKDTNLFDLIALLFTEACENVLRQGLIHDYVEVESDLSVLRGRLRVAEQVRVKFGRIDQLACRYDDHLSDIRENRLLAAALTVCRKRVHDNSVRNRVHRQHATFAMSCNPHAEPISELVQPFAYHRLNSHYEDAHQLARLILSVTGIDDLLAIGNTRSFAFLLNMNQLFEAFVAKLLTTLLSNQWRVDTQFRESSVIWNVNEQRTYTTIRPDVVVTNQAGERIAVDAKYKNYDAKKLSPADIYQTFVYAYAFQGERPKALVLYPAEEEQLSITKLDIRTVDRQHGAQIIAASLPIPQIIDEIIGGNLSSGLLGQIAALFAD